MSQRNRFFAFLGVLLIAATIYYFLSTDSSSDLVLIGTIDSNQIVVSPKIAGRLERLAVNEGDEVIGQERRSEVHRLGLQHRAVHVLIFNGKSEVFLQKRSMTKDTFPGAWDSSASGHLDTGESYDACAVRELREELGLVLSAPPQRLFKLAACLETGQEHVWVYRHQAEGPFQLNADEIEAGGWFAPDAVTRWMQQEPEAFASALRKIWEALF